MTSYQRRWLHSYMQNLKYSLLIPLLLFALAGSTTRSPARSGECLTVDGRSGVQLRLDCFDLGAEKLNLVAQDFTSALKQFRSVKQIEYHGSSARELPDISAISKMETLERLIAGKLIVTDLE